MNSRWMIVPVLVTVMVFGTLVGAEEGAGRPWAAALTVGATATDNRDGLDQDKESNVDVSVEPRVDYFLRSDQGALNLFLAPALKWHSNPRSQEEGDPQNDVELFGRVGVDVTHRPTRRMGIKLGDTLTYTDDPEITEGGASVRQSASHLLNVGYGQVGLEVTPKVAALINGQVTTKRYEEDAVADYEDEDTLSGDLAVKYLMGSGFNVLAFAGYADFENKSPDWDRGSQLASVGG